MATKKTSAVGIKKLWYIDPDVVEAQLSETVTDIGGKQLYALRNTVKVGGTGDDKDDPVANQVLNSHQDTWTIEESEPSQDAYKNQLTGGVYRMGKKEMGDLTFNWTIGQYDYATKAVFLGGTATATSWKRARGIVEIKLALVALTEDDQYCLLPYANIAANEANTDGAVGIAIKGTAMEPENEALASEYWFDKDAVVAA